MELEPIICFETHVELKTRTKLFCDCSVSYDSPPNSRICPVCTAQPGALPVLNRRAVEYAVKAGLALHCDINRRSWFARKNYFYPDLPKGYQISQYEHPLCENGYLEIPDDAGNSHEVGIRRIHLEEDAGKLLHSSGSLGGSDYSLVDYNRAGVPLLEIVGDHKRNPLRSAQEARSYLEKLRQTLRYIGISDCIIEKGQFRCDVNVSLRPMGTQRFGNRTEIKNMGSLRFIMEAIEHEIGRQRKIIASGGEVSQETRLFDEKKRITLPMRGKEDAPDYRYFRDPDLADVELDERFIARIKESIPELPDQRVGRFTEQYGIHKDDVLLLTRDSDVADFFVACAASCHDRIRLSHWITKDLFKLLNDARLSIKECPVSPGNFSRLINLITDGEVTEQIGRTILRRMFVERCDPDTLVSRNELSPVRDLSLIENIVSEVIAENPEAVSKIRKGAVGPLNFLVGRVMKKTGGKADAGKVKEIIQAGLEG